jgi:hypothetical protein
MGRQNNGGFVREQGPPKSFFDALEREGGGAVDGYNRYWLNQGTQYTVVDGQIRTSIVIDPTDGRVPPYNAAARKRGASRRGIPTSHSREKQRPVVGAARLLR